jgi:hypothetical protein
LLPPAAQDLDIVNEDDDDSRSISSGDSDFDIKAPLIQKAI